MTDKNDAVETEPQIQDDVYLPCVHQRIAARLIQQFKSEEKRQELLELSASWQN